MRVFSAIAACLTLCTMDAGANPPQYAGPNSDGAFLLPNGWTITPAGSQVILKDLPLNILTTPDGRSALVATSGFNAHELSRIDIEAKQVRDVLTVRESWFGLVANSSCDRLWWSGGGGAVLHALKLENGKLARLHGDDPTANTGGAKPSDTNFRSGLCFDEKKAVLYSLDMDAGILMAVDLTGQRPERRVTLGGRPYDVALARNGSRLYVSDWANGTLLAVNPDDLRITSRIQVGEHPNQIAVSPTDDRMFVACASTNQVSVLDTKRGIIVETIHTALFPQAPEGSTPCAVAIKPDGSQLFVANADNNCVVVVDVRQAGASAVQGFIPTGWYPTALAVTPDSKHLLIGVGKGNSTQANPIPADPSTPLPNQTRKLPFPYIGTTLSGALSILTMPTDEELAQYTAQVYRNCPYSDKLLTDAPYPETTAIPSKVGDPSPIKHVIYIIKENRTFDQVLGDLGRGNGDPTLVMFGENVTPNHHKLANEFVVLDNLYCNGHVSADGHPWSTMAYNTDYVARNWALTYSGREGIEDDEEGDLQKGPSGYIWDACARSNMTYRSYGEYGSRVSQPDGSARMEARVPGLVDHICPSYGIPKEPGQRTRDTDNVETFLKEFREFEANGNLPQFIIMSLGEDHTSGTRPDAYTPQACVASNDVALGRLVEAVSKSKYWPEMAIFVIEDDAQNGPDHVDAHRTVGFVISPYTKRKTVDSTQYTTVSMLRTIELILGLSPLSQFDAAANPMFASFTNHCDATPYVALPARIDLNQKNSPLAYGADRSLQMDFSEYDRIDDFELNEILWRAVKGPDATLPPAVRRAIAYRLNPR